MHVIAVGGSDAGISAALRIRELDPGVEVSVVLADAYPNFSICGIPYHVSGEVADWRSLAHRSLADLEATGMRVLTDTTVTAVDAAARRVHTHNHAGTGELAFDALILGTGAHPVRPPVPGLAGLGPADGVHLLHTMGDMFAVLDSLHTRQPATALVIGAGYIGLEMADALTTRGIAVTQVEQLDQVLPTVDSGIAEVVGAELAGHGVQVVTGTAITSLAARDGHLHVEGTGGFAQDTDLVLVVTGVAPDTQLAAAAGVELGQRGAIAVDRQMRTNLPGIWAAGDCVVTHHRLLGATYLPLGTTAHKQGRVAGENALGGHREFAGSLGTQVVKVFDLAVARTGLRDHEALAVGCRPATVGARADDHKAYYPGARLITAHITGDTTSGALLGAQLVGHRDASIAKRIDIYATALHTGLTVDQLSDLDLSYTPPLGSPWDAVQVAAQAWTRRHSSPARPGRCRAGRSAGRVGDVHAHD